MSDEEDALKRYSERNEHVREKIAGAIWDVKMGNSWAAIKVQEALGAFFGMLRDYGETPAWRYNASWEYDFVILEPPLDMRPLMKDRGLEGWELCAVLPHGDGDFQLVFKRMLA